MKISLEADYAVRIIQCLADEDQRMNAKAIAQKTRVTPKFTLKILHKLAVASIVKSYKGIGGGYELAKPGEEINLREVIECIEGPIILNRCLQEDFACDHPEQCNCYFQDVFYEASKEMAERFEKVNFAKK